jgi:hypothetical protein
VLIKQSTHKKKKKKKRKELNKREELESKQQGQTKMNKSSTQTPQVARSMLDKERGRTPKQNT